MKHLTRIAALLLVLLCALLFAAPASADGTDWPQPSGGGNGGGFEMEQWSSGQNVRKSPSRQLSGGAANRVVFMLVTLPGSITVTSIGLGTTSGSIQGTPDYSVGLYDLAGDLVFQASVDEAPSSGATLTTTAVTGGPVDVDAGQYWLATTCDAASSCGADGPEISTAFYGRMPVGYISALATNGILPASMTPGSIVVDTTYTQPIVLMF